MATTDACREDNTIKIRYAGPTGNHLVASPLRKFPHYGMHTNGDVFCVHVDDQRTVPHIFVLVEERKVAPMAPPTPEPEPAAPAPEPVTTDPLVDSVTIDEEVVVKPAQDVEAKEQSRKRAPKRGRK